MVEIDEMFVCHRKYNVGRKTVKEGTWVLGLTEVDAASHPIENREALARLKVREESREQAARERAERRKRLKEQRMAERLRSFPSSFTRTTAPLVRPPQGAALPPQRRDPETTEDDSDDEQEPDSVEIVRVDDADDDEVLEERLSRIEFERQMSRLFPSPGKIGPRRRSSSSSGTERRRRSTGSSSRTSYPVPLSTRMSGRGIPA